MYTEILSTWEAQTNERKKLQSVYAAIFAFGLVVAGLLSLLNTALGAVSLQIAIGSLALFITNVIVWSLVSMGMSTIDEKQRKTTASARRRK